jgi:predicted RNase H-like nuclease (RuvC/YqgF family)
MINQVQEQVVQVEQKTQLTVENSTKEQRLEAEIRNLQAKIDNLTKTKKAKEKALRDLRKKNSEKSQSNPNQELLEQNKALQAQLAAMMAAMEKAGIPVENLTVSTDSSKENPEPEAVTQTNEENSSEGRDTTVEPIQVSDQPSQQDQEE